MLYPSIDEMVKKVDSKYTLVVAASRRARMLRNGEKSELLSPRSHKFVGVALEEIYGDIIQVEKVATKED
ncbi:DNA-directed RNA polymerase subunit omega [Paenibacillus sp. MY03]|jgi:DNA-directed RNA polymerase subunit omega|uniref:DNA-directed RNA polymerase subunit omega n=1 Tax=Paenibacillus agaridevorans TaxID=171404 RepID=A0A2R5EI80_9BACL|nr:MULTISPECIES: DNA-directed RNA polymerase subunit omega [Paenibacillus]OUS76932.1 DNA-directed RNA polymerase subunit omega [Paenibacillus sp. MY03]QNK54641.1 DNA-directed RNA polymerase subunit omega [Paenibacillus sp. PAMC21692]GBG06306.1 DNA-directed RNA polymerase subunit omega [Paenibacillus agaridevorans]